jgi:hypothetical protein
MLLIFRDELRMLMTFQATVNVADISGHSECR